MTTTGDTGRWAEHAPGAVYRCPVYLSPGEGGLVSAVAATLPGVASQGRSPAEALANVREALAGAIRVYRDAGESIPWAEQPRRPDGRLAVIRWVVLEVG